MQVEFSRDVSAHGGIDDGVLLMGGRVAGGVFGKVGLEGIGVLLFEMRLVRLVDAVRRHSGKESLNPSFGFLVRGAARNLWFR